MMSSIGNSSSKVTDFQLAFEQNRNKFEKTLSSYWLNNVSKLINAADPNFDVETIDQLLQQEVITLVEVFVFGDQKMEKFVEEFEKGSQQKPTKCGGVFRSGDPHYSCRECSTDQTCVLCAECFQASEHKMHKYRIGNSAGGGCCDCGDEEAWKRFPHCAIHKPDESQSQTLQPLPANVELKLRTMYEIIVQYFTHYLNIHTNEFHHPESMRSSVNEYSTILHNDELHTFDQVIDALKRALRCEATTAKYFATLVDREGRHCIFKGPRSECENVKEKIDHAITRASVHLPRRKPLHTLVVNVQLIAFQVVCQRLLRWMVDAVSKLGQFRRLFCDVMLEQIEGQTRLESSILSDTMLWKSVRIDWHGLIIKTFLIDYDHKKQFATYFIKHYNRIQQDYAEDEHHHVLSIAAMTVQIFTVPSIAKFLVFECDALSVVLKTLITACTNNKRDSSKLEFDLKAIKSNLPKYHYCIHHAQYLLHNIPETWTNRNVFCNAFRLYAELQASMENLNAVKREVKHHIEIEPEWEPAMRLQLAMNRVNFHFPTWAATCPKVLSSCLDEVLRLMQRDPLATVKTENKLFFGIAVDCIADPVEINPVSLHLQLNRLFVALLCKYFQQKSSSRCYAIPPPLMAEFRRTCTKLMEPCLRAVVLAAQVVHANMWKRNGFSLQNQVHFYHKTPGRVQMYNLDIALLQFCAAISESMDVFLINVMNKFHSKLLDWITRRPESPAALDDLSKTYLALIEEFLYLLIVLLSERHLLLGSKSNDPSENIKYEILHLLMLGGLSHSEIMKKITLSEDHAEIDANLFEIADFNGQRKKFEPKAQAIEQHFNPMCYHLSKSELTAIESKLLKEKKAKQEPEYISPPKLDAIKPELDGILRIFESDVFLLLLHTLLKRALQMSDRYYTENIVYYGVYLISLGLQEEINEFKASEGNNSSVPHPTKINFATKCFAFKNPQVDSRSIGCYLRELIKTNGRVDNYKNLIEFVLETQTRVLQMRAKLESLHGNETDANVDMASVADGSLDSYPRTKVSVASNDSARRKSRNLAKKTRELALAEMQKAREKFSAKYYSELDEIVTNDQKEPEMSVEASSTFPVLLGPECTPIETQCNENVNVCIVCKSDENNLDSAVSSQSLEESLIEDDSEVGASTIGAAARERYARLMSHPSSRPTSHRQPILPKVKSAGSKAKSSPEDSTDHLMVQIVLIQRTHLFCQNRDENLPTDMESFELVPPLATSRWGSVVSSCGHNIHYVCWHRYFKNLVKYERNRLGIRPGKTLAYNLEKGEFLCPMCGALGNATIPLVQPSLITSTVLLSPDEPELPREKIHRQDSQLTNELYFGHLYDFVTFMSTRQNPDDHSNLMQNMNFRSKDKDFSTNLPENVSRLVEHFAECVYTRSLDVNPDENNERIPIVGWNSVASTLLVQEYCSRFAQKSFFRRSLKLQCFDSMCRNLLLMPKVSNKYLNFCKKQAVKLFHDIFLNFNGVQALYNLDLFTYMVYMVSSMHLLLADDIDQVNMSTMNMRQQVYMFLFRHFLNLHIVQIFLKLALRLSLDSTTTASCTDESPGEQPMQTDTNGEEMQQTERRACWQDPKSISIVDVFLLLAARAEISVPTVEATVSRLLSRLEVCLLPWLRCCGMLFKCLLIAPMPAQLEEDDNNMELLCQYLGIPFDLEVLLEPIKISLLKQTPLTDFVLQLCECARTSNTEAACEVQYPLEPIQLISLPHDYTDLINQPIKLCPTTNDVMRNPAICLLCGEVVCSGSYCCQMEDSATGQTKGASTLHAEGCSGPCGMFLRPLDCEILLISASGKGCFFKAPYVDEYGETDSGLKRGNPLFLNEEMLSNLKLMWFSQAISETVSRQLARANYRLLAFDWNEM